MGKQEKILKTFGYLFWKFELLLNKMGERYNIHSQLEHLQSKYIGTGHADTTKYDWMTNQAGQLLVTHQSLRHDQLLRVGGKRIKSQTQVQSCRENGPTLRTASREETGGLVQITKATKAFPIMYCYD